MVSFLHKQADSEERGIRYKLIVIEALIFALPFLIVAFIFYQGGYSLKYSHIILLAIVTTLILTGMIIVRQIFDKISSVASIMKEAESGTLTTVDIKKDVAELHDISASFNQLIQKLETTTGKLSKRALELLTIKELSEIARKSLHMEELLELLLEKAMIVTGAHIGSVFMVDETAKRFRIIALKGANYDIDKNHYIDIDDSIAKWVIVEKKPLLIENIEKDERTLKPNDPRYGSPSFLSMPIFIESTVAAILNLANKDSGQTFESYDEQALSIMLGEISFALENAMLHMKVEDHIKEMKERNLTLEKEIGDRLAAEGKLASLNKELEEANMKLGLAYAKMKENRDDLRENLFKEEMGLILDNEGRIEGVTEKLLEFTEKSRDKLLGTNVMDLLHQNCREFFVNELKQAWKGIAHQISIDLISEKDNVKPFEMKLTRISLDDRRLLLAILR
jgi:PAS domain-containing protein